MRRHCYTAVDQNASITDVDVDVDIAGSRLLLNVVGMSWERQLASARIARGWQCVVAKQGSSRQRRLCSASLFRHMGIASCTQSCPATCPPAARRGVSTCMPCATGVDCRRAGKDMLDRHGVRHLHAVDTLWFAGRLPGQYVGQLMVLLDPVSKPHSPTARIPSPQCCVTML
jgi:hypothetical protein